MNSQSEKSPSSLYSIKSNAPSTFMPSLYKRLTCQTRLATVSLILPVALVFSTIAMLCYLAVRPIALFAQEGDSGIAPTELMDTNGDALEAPDQVDIEPTARDEEIAARLVTILQATEWFQTPRVSVSDGVVFLDGSAETEEYRTWAGNLARNTQDVVAVVNRLEVVQRSPWDFSPAFSELRSIGREALQILPLMIFGLFILSLAWLAMRYTSQLADRLLRQRVQNRFLRNLTTTTLSIPVFLLGLYLVLQVSGLTRLAITVLGGTGIAGLIVGIGFRDIMENFLATVLISTRNPFQTGDRIEVAGHLGIVQQVNSRTTVLMALDGNYIQIPNAVIYKSTIRNYTANPKQRLDFAVGIGYDDDLLAAQQAIIDTLREHPTILPTPEPLALVDSLGAATVNLRIYFWVDTNVHEEKKVKSSVIRLVKRALDDGGFSMPDEAREVIFPQGVPIQGMTAEYARLGHEHAAQNKETKREHSPKQQSPSEPLATQAEGGLASEDEQIKEQARATRAPEEDTNLLQS